MVACTAPLAASGPDGMVGRITDASGAPVVGLRVTSVEEEDDTDADGRFEVRWKAPEQHLRFRWGPMAVERRYQPSDDGAVVAIGLPPTRDVVVVCPPVACALSAAFTLDAGFVATYRVRCEPGAEHTVAGMPVGTADIRCLAGHGSDAAAVGAAFDDGGRLGAR